MHNPFTALQYPKSKLAILVLLTINAVVYAWVDTLTSTVDALSWLALLLIYELETNTNHLPVAASTLQSLRNGLIGVILLVFVSYLNSSEWLDVANSLLWFALIALLEMEVRWPDRVVRHAKTYWIATMSIFGGLIAMAGIWLWQALWLDAYDALLWIVAFGFIEVDLFHFLKRKQPGV